MSFANPLYDPSRRRRAGARRHRHAPPPHHSPLTRLATTAAVAYGAYRLGAWAWNAYFGDEADDNKEEDENREDGGDLFDDWMTDRSPGDYRAIEREIRREEGFPNGDLSEEEETTDGEGDSVNGGGRGRNGNRMKPLPLRSRRSRGDWDHNHVRSHRPSPPQDYRNHHIIRPEDPIEGEDGGGTAKMGMKNAATAAATGIGAAVGAGITAGIKAYNYNQGSNQPPQSAAADQERRLRMGRCRLETARAMVDFLPTLKKAVAKETDTGAETEGLKRLRIRKKDILEIEESGDAEDALAMDQVREEERRLWNDVKNKSVTRLVTTVYAHTIVFLVLTVQVNLLGGRLLREEREEMESTTGLQRSQSSMPSGADRFRTSHRTVLAKTYHHLFSKGIPSLAESVERAATEALRKWDVLEDSPSLRDVSAWLDRVREEVERHHKEVVGGLNPLLEFVIPPEGEAALVADNATENSADETEEDELARYILDETYDLLESPAYAKAQRRCLDATFDQLRNKVVGGLFLSEDRVPLANVVTHLQKLAVMTFHKPPSYREEMKGWEGVLGMMDEPLPSALPNAYISKLERLEDVLELAEVCF